MAAVSVAEKWRFVQQVARGRWFSVFASFLVMIGAGATYMYGNYSKVLKSRFNYTQTQINTLGFAKDLGSNFGVVAGLSAEVLPMWALFVIGSFLNFYSYFMMWLSATGRLSQPSFKWMCIYIGLATNSQNFANTAALVTNVENFPDRRGIILGLLKGFVGIGGAVLTQIHLATYGHSDPSHLLLLLAWLPSTISLVMLLAVRKLNVPKDPNELSVFYQLLSVSVILAIFLMGLTLTQKQVVFSATAYRCSATVILGILCLPLLIAVKEEYARSKQETAPVVPNVSISMCDQKSPTEIAPKNPSLINEIKGDNSIPWYSNITKKPERGEDFTILQALLSTDMALLFLSTLCGTGSTIATIDNLGQIGESLGYPAKAISGFVSFVSILNFFGRVFSGFISESLLEKYKVPRPLLFSLIHLLTCIGQLFIAFPSPGSVYAASCIVGFAFGAQVPLIFAIISEVFGLKHYSTLFNCGQLAVPIGSYLINVEIIGSHYDYEALKKGTARDGAELTCIGANCFSAAFKSVATVTFFGSMMSLLLAFRTWKFYKSDIYKKFREDIWIPKSDMEFYCLNKKSESDKDTKYFPI